MGKWAIRFAMLLTLMILVVSYIHTVQLYTDIGYGLYEAYTITAFIEGIFLLSTVTLARNRLSGQHSGWPLKCGFAYGAFHVLFSNLHHSADLSYLFESGIAGWVLGISILVGLIIIELIVSYGVSENKRTADRQSQTTGTHSVQTIQTDNKPSDKTDSARETDEKGMSKLYRTDAVSELGSDNVKADSKRTNEMDGQLCDETDNIRPVEVPSDVSDQLFTDNVHNSESIQASAVPKVNPGVIVNNAISYDMNNGGTDDKASVQKVVAVSMSDNTADTDCPNVTVGQKADGQFNSNNPSGQQTDVQGVIRTADSGQSESGRTEQPDTDKKSRTESDNGQRTERRASEKTKKGKKVMVTEEVVEQVYLRIVKDTGVVPSIRGLMKAAGSSKYMADKIIKRYTEEKAG